MWITIEDATTKRLNLDRARFLGLRENPPGSWEVRCTMDDASVWTVKGGFASQSAAVDHIGDVLPGVGV